MANSPRDGRSGSGPLDTDQAERLAELFQPSWEVGSKSSGASPKGRAEMDKFGSTTAPEVPVPAHKKTLVGLPVPTPVMPASKMPGARPSAPPVQPAAAAAAAEAAARAASKRTLMGVAPPSVGRSTSRSSQPPPVKVPSHAPPPPPPADAVELKSRGKGTLPAPPLSEPAAKSSPRSSRPSGVAKAYVPKEDPHTPAVVVDEAALRDGEAAAAAEEARRRARVEAARHAKTMRARPGELGFEHEVPKKSRKLLWVLGFAAAGALGVVGFLGLRSSDGSATIGEEPVEPPKAEAESAPIPTVASPEALPVESPDQPEQVASPEPAAPVVVPAREPVRAEPRPAKPQPASRQTAAPKRASDPSPSRPAQSEPKKTAEPQKKNVIVRDAPF